jgi:acetyl-CoA carboxylase biotin carboxylase subunit
LGYEVPVDYDPIISKLTVHAPDRNSAITKMASALKNYYITGVKTPIAFLLEIVQSKPFIKGEIYTDFIPHWFNEWAQSVETMDMATISFIADEVFGKLQKNSDVNVSENRIPEPWETLGNWKM